MSDIHQHYCRQCRASWEHDGDQIKPGTVRANHQCPSCGTPGWVKYFGTESHDEMCEAERLLEISEDETQPEDVRLQADRNFIRLAQRLHRPCEPQPTDEEVDSRIAVQKLLALLKGL